jgi:hypothetical protein
VIVVYNIIEAGQKEKKCQIASKVLELQASVELLLFVIPGN